MKDLGKIKALFAAILSTEDKINIFTGPLDSSVLY